MIMNDKSRPGSPAKVGSMGLGTLLGGKVLKELLGLSPQIITTAEQLYSTVNRNRRMGADTESPLNSRLINLEAANAAQTELLEQMAGQIRVLALAMEQLTLRSRRLTILAGGAGLLSVLSILLLLIREFYS